MRHPLSHGCYILSQILDKYLTKETNIWKQLRSIGIENEVFHGDCFPFLMKLGWCRFGQMVACFRYASIDVYSVYLPPSKLDFNSERQEWIEKELNEVNETGYYFNTNWFLCMSNALSFTLYNCMSVYLIRWLGELSFCSPKYLMLFFWLKKNRAIPWSFLNQDTI